MLGVGLVYRDALSSLPKIVVEPFLNSHDTSSDGGGFSVLRPNGAVGLRSQFREARLLMRRLSLAASGSRIWDWPSRRRSRTRTSRDFPTPGAVKSGWTKGLSGSTIAHADPAASPERPRAALDTPPGAA